jgi:spore coat protein A, manganese oxidase
LLTTVWGYAGAYPGPTFEVQSGQPINVHWTNNLVDDEGNPLPPLLPVDTSIHWAAPAGWPDSGVPTVVHLHGGNTESASDGYPEAWFTPNFAQKGPQWVKETYTYDNDQEAANLWYHDHALGLTRLNVGSGLAGMYIIHDANEASLNLPSGDYDVPLVIQDRMFQDDGSLYFPSAPPTAESPDPSVLPEFFGNMILVNGEVWPFMEVQPRKYRFRLLNGSDSRFYDLSFGGAKVYQIGSDQGLLDSPVRLRHVLIAPAERVDLIVDFTNVRGKDIIVRNTAKAPFPGGDAGTLDKATTGQVMQFRVSRTKVADDSSLPRQLRETPIAKPGTPNTVRPLLLMETMDEFGRVEPLLGTARDGGLMWHDPISENPLVGTTEVWEFYNTTNDAHPIHVHLVHFQEVSHQKFKADVDPVTGALTNIRLRGRASAPSKSDAGLKDTIIVMPGEVVRVEMTFDRSGLYVWHCHIISHEDHDMMRPFFVSPAVTPSPDMRTMTSAQDAATPASSGAAPEAATPNDSVAASGSSLPDLLTAPLLTGARRDDTADALAEAAGPVYSPRTVIACVADDAPIVANLSDNLLADVLPTPLPALL